MPDVAAAGCKATRGGVVPTSPTGDPIGDLEVSPLSHEADESITDPQVGSGYTTPPNSPKPGAEIGDECAYDYAGIEPAPDNSNVHMGTLGDPFVFQTEWSNINNGCTLDPSGAPARTDITLVPDSSTGTFSTFPVDGIPVNFQEAGEDNIGTEVPAQFFGTPCSNSLCSNTITVYVTPDGGGGINNLRIDPVVLTVQEWCFDLPCDSLFGGVSSPTAITYVYYHLLAQDPYICLNPFIFHGVTLCGSSAANFPIDMLYVGPQNSAGSSDAIQTLSLVLGVNPQRIFLVAGSQASWDNCTPSTGSPPPSFALNCGSSAGERWSNGGLCSTVFDCFAQSGTILQPDSITNLNYWDQFLFTASYSLTGGGTPTPPALSSTQFGNVFSAALSSSPSSNWLDSGATWKVTNPLVGSSSSERWETNAPVSGTVTGATTISPQYFHQFDFTLNYMVIDGGTPAAPMLSATQFGTVYAPSLTSPPVQYWLDSGTSWSVNNPLLGSGGSERWQTATMTSGTVSAPQTSIFNYYHQYLVPVSYFTSDGSTIPSTPPSFTGTSFGAAAPPVTLSTTPQSEWLDSGSSWSVSPQTLAGSTSTVRWFAQTASGTESGTSPIRVEYLHQYFVTFTVITVGPSCSNCGGTTSPTSEWVNAGLTITIVATPSSGYTFASWTSSTSKIHIFDSGLATTTALINGPGTITARFHP